MAKITKRLKRFISQTLEAIKQQTIACGFGRALFTYR
jgi:hypothetical protein